MVVIIPSQRHSAWGSQWHNFTCGQQNLSITNCLYSPFIDCMPHFGDQVDNAQRVEEILVLVYD